MDINARLWVKGAKGFSDFERKTNVSDDIMSCYRSHKFENSRGIPSVMYVCTGNTRAYREFLKKFGSDKK